MAAGGGESPHPPPSSWGSGPRPPKRALTCATRCGAPSGRAAPRRAALPLRAPPRGVARAGAPRRRRSAASDCSHANNFSSGASPVTTGLQRLPSGGRALQVRTLAISRLLPSPPRSQDGGRGLRPPDFFFFLLIDSAQAAALGPGGPPLGHRAPTLTPTPPRRSFGCIRGNLLLRAVGHDAPQPLSWASFGSSYCCV